MNVGVDLEDEIFFAIPFIIVGAFLFSLTISLCSIDFPACFLDNILYKRFFFLCVGLSIKLIF